MNSDNSPSLKPESQRTDEPSAAPPVTLRSEELLRGGREILIQHANDVYRLRITRNGKLILTK
ncbi:MAG TPA: hemin uptake protein HemP [Planctomycetaceae bacterium]|jgi:hemin uptake protein HemP